MKKVVPANIEKIQQETEEDICCFLRMEQEDALVPFGDKRWNKEYTNQLSGLDSDTDFVEWLQWVKHPSEADPGVNEFWADFFNSSEALNKFFWEQFRLNI